MLFPLPFASRDFFVLLILYLEIVYPGLLQWECPATNSQNNIFRTYFKNEKSNFHCEHNVNDTYEHCML